MASNGVHFQPWLKIHISWPGQLNAKWAFSLESSLALIRKNCPVSAFDRRLYVQKTIPSNLKFIEITFFDIEFETNQGDKCTEDDYIFKFYELNRGVGTYIGHACNMESPQNRTFFNYVRLNFISHDSSNRIQNHGGFMANVYTEGNLFKVILGHISYL